MTTHCDRVSMWRSPSDPVFSIEPARLEIGDEHASFEVAAKNWPHGLDSDEVLDWPVIAHHETDDGLELAYEGEIVDVDERVHYGGTKRTLKCKPAADPQSQFLPGALQP